MLVLGIETSCDETSAAVVRDGRDIRSNIVSSQIELHRPFGGVVPEIASRQHLRHIDSIIQQSLDTSQVTLDEIDAVAATRGPGLATSLLIGISTGKAIAAARNIPFLGINHLEGHLLSPFLGRPDTQTPGHFPFVSLIVSGGHTLLAHVRDLADYTVLGQTVDDAAGEAFDKVAKLLGLGYPGGPEIDKLAREGDRAAVNFPRSMQHSGDFNFSFSGLKTAVMYHLRKQTPSSVPSPQSCRDLCASFQEAVVDVLVEKTIAAAREKGVSLITASGGVTCNSRLRERLAAACQQNGVRLLLADARLCTDNAAMIAAVAALHLQRGKRDAGLLDVEPNLALA